MQVINASDEFVRYPKKRLLYTALEPFRLPGELMVGQALQAWLKQMPKGDGHPVLVIPPFMAGDRITSPLRRHLQHWGYDVHGWGLGTNLGQINIDSLQAALDERNRLLELLIERVHAIHGETQRRLSLIGWSLGGLHARQIAKRHPRLIRQVITMGSPLGDPRGTSIFLLMHMRTKSEPSEAEVARWTQHLNTELQVPATAIYSNSDGLVLPEIARIQRDKQAQSIRVRSTHVGMAINPRVYYILNDRLKTDEDDWQPMRIPAWLRYSI